MSDLIEAELKRLFPDVELNADDRKEIAAAADPAKIAASLESRALAIRRNFDNHFGEGVAQNRDVVTVLMLDRFQTIGTLSRRHLFQSVGHERAFELGRRSNDYWRGLFMKHIGTVDQEGYDWWSERSEAWFVEAAKRDGTLKGFDK